MTDVAIGPDGKKMLAVDTGKPVNLSTDGGQTWTALEGISSSLPFFSCAIGSDNMTMLIGTYDGELYFSNNGGASWTLKPGPDSGLWAGLTGVAIASDCVTMFLCCYNGRCWKTDDAWSTWSEVRPKGDVSSTWSRISCSYSAEVVVATEFNGRVYRSLNSCADWSEIQPAGDIDVMWMALAVGWDGKTILIGDIEISTLYRSSDSGDSWGVETVFSTTGVESYFGSVSLGGTSLYAAAAANMEPPTAIYRAALGTESEGELSSVPSYPLVKHVKLIADATPSRVDEVEILKLPIEGDEINIS